MQDWDELELERSNATWFWRLVVDAHTVGRLIAHKNVVGMMYWTGWSHYKRKMRSGLSRSWRKDSPNQICFFNSSLLLYDCKTIHVSRVFSRYTFYKGLISHSPYLANISHCAHKLRKCLVVTSKNICETRSFHVIVFTTKFFFTCPSTECNQDWPN